MTKDCCGPFKYGVPGRAVNPKQQCFVDCCGNMCPPEDCCDVILIHYKCGSTNQEYECDCTYENINFHGLLLKKKNNLPAIPSFNLSQQDSEEQNFNLVCSIPCSQTVLTLTTSGCCLYMNGGTIYAVGSGNLNFNLSNETLQGCGKISVKINDSITESNTMPVNDGDEITVTLAASDECCACCEVKRECDPETTMWVLKKEGNKQFLSLNKSKFIRRLNTLRKQKIIGKFKRIKSR